MEKTYRKNAEGKMVEVIPQEVIPEKEIVVDLSDVRNEMVEIDKQIAEDQMETNYYVDRYQARVALAIARKAELQAKLDKATELNVEIPTEEVIEQPVI